MPATKKSGSNKKSNAKAKKTTQSSNPTTTPAPEPVVVAPEPVVAAPVESSSTNTTATQQTPVVSLQQSIEEQFASLSTKLSELRSLESTIMSDLRTLQKTTTKYLKSLNKKSSKSSGDKKPRAPSGFAKPTRISEELCTFLNIDKDTEMARTEVTKHLTQYIKANKLQDKTNMRRILPDKKLQKLLKVTPEDEVTYFNLQKYMKVHFPKKEVVASA